MKKKIKKDSDNFLLQNELKLDKKNIIQRKLSTNSNFQKESKILNSKLINLDTNNPFIPHNIRHKNNLNLLPIKKAKSKTENEINNNFSLFFNGENNFSSKNEVNLITTQYNYGNNLLLIDKSHKTSKDFSSKKIKIHSLNNINNNNNNYNINNINNINNNINNINNINNNINNINNNIIKDELLITHLNIGQKLKTKKDLFLNELKNKKNMIIKEIPTRIYEDLAPLLHQQNIENNNNVNLNLNKIGNNIPTKKLPGLLKIKNNKIDLINYLSIPPKDKLITPLLQNKVNYIRKKSEIIRRKISKIEDKEKEKNSKDYTFGHKIHWKKISLLKEGEICKIYKAFNISNGFIFIVKEYKIDNKDNKESRKNKKLFYNEAKFLKIISHKNVVHFIDAEVVDNDYFYIYLNFIGGYNLKEFYSKVGFFTKSLLKSFIEQILYFLDYMKFKGLVYNNFSFSHFMFDLDGTIKILNFSKVITQNDIIKNSYARHNEDVDFFNFKNMILNIIYYEKSNNFNNNELSNDICNFCNFLENSLVNISTLSEFKSNYYFKDKEETIYMKNSSIIN